MPVFLVYQQHVAQTRHVLLDGEPSSCQHVVWIPAVELPLSNIPASTAIITDTPQSNSSTAAYTLNIETLYSRIKSTAVKNVTIHYFTKISHN